MTFDYKKYSLENLENWMHDALSCSEATPQEIYDVIKNVVTDNYYCYKNHTERCYELLALLNSGVDNNKYQDYLNEILSCDKDDKSPECQQAWNDFWEENKQYTEEELNAMCNKAESQQDKVVKWQLPVELDGLSGECYVMFPDDLLEAANLKEGDTVEWIDRKDGSFELRKVGNVK
jgi:hypothetical protein